MGYIRLYTVRLRSSGPTACQLRGAVHRLVTLAMVGVVHAKSGLRVVEQGCMHGDTWAILGMGCGGCLVR